MSGPIAQSFPIWYLVLNFYETQKVVKFIVYGPYFLYNLLSSQIGQKCFLEKKVSKIDNPICEHIVENEKKIILNSD